MSNNLLKQNSHLVGAILGLGSEALSALLLWAGLAIAGQPMAGHERWFAAIFIAPLLLLRHYAKSQQQLRVTQALIVTLFVTFVAFMALLLTTKTLELQ
ncbi:MAG: hypothetical protein IJ789_01030 [Bacteroidales bacterium]|nr:hypothetical protein [Bacteroidales bacterium]